MLELSVKSKTIKKENAWENSCNLNEISIFGNSTKGTIHKKKPIDRIEHMKI